MEGWNILSTGGRLKPDTLALIGSQCHEMIRNYHVDKVIMSCKGIDPAGGVTDSSEDHSATSRP